MSMRWDGSFHSFRLLNQRNASDKESQNKMHYKGIGLIIREMQSGLSSPSFSNDNYSIFITIMWTLIGYLHSRVFKETPENIRKNTC